MGSPFSPSFTFKNFNIHSVEGASCVNIGNNHPNGFRSSKKHNQGFGNVTGNKNDFNEMKSLIHDKALIDMISSSELDDLPWLKDLLISQINEMEDEDDDSELEDEMDDPWNEGDGGDGDEDEDEDDDDEKDDDLESDYDMSMLDFHNPNDIMYQQMRHNPNIYTNPYWTRPGNMNMEDDRK